MEDRTLILADISYKAVNQVDSSVAGLLEKHMPEKKAESFAALITTGQFTGSHQVSRPGISTQITESIYRIMELYPQRGKGRPSVNYVPVAKIG